MIDKRTKYPDVEFMRSTSTSNIIFALEQFFSSYGIPNNMVSDYGLPFALYELQGYFAAKGIRHHRTRPLWPQANGQVERFMPTLNKVSQTAFLESKDWKLELYINFDFLIETVLKQQLKYQPPILCLIIKFTIAHIDNKINIDSIHN